jgi:phosphoribosylformimino-5-aminoimidazole carboxamide ribotide isomerase
MDLLPAIDVMDGGAVRLVRGDFGRRSDHGDPVTLARRYLEAGARWLHVVDLDAARTGDAVNRSIVLALVAEAHRAGAAVEIGGGVRTEPDLDALVEAGADRVVLGTAAVEVPGFAVRCARRHPGRVAVGVDFRRRADGSLEPAVGGWLGDGGRGLAEVLDELAGAPVACVVATAIDRDGTLGGPDTDGLAEVLDATEVAVVASGGVASGADLRRLAALRSPGAGRSPAGAVVGKALVNGALTVEEALAACAPCG